MKGESVKHKNIDNLSFVCFAICFVASQNFSDINWGRAKKNELGNGIFQSLPDSSQADTEMEK